MVLGKKMAIFDWNGAEIRPLEMGRNGPVCPMMNSYHSCNRPLNIWFEARLGKLAF